MTAADALAELRRLAEPRIKADLLQRYGIVAPSAFGVGMAKIQALAKRIGRSHALAADLWATGQYEARLLACYVDRPEDVTKQQMDRWCRDFDNWGIVDTVCFKLFDQVETSLAFGRADAWAAQEAEFVKRAGLVMLACLALHDRVSEDAEFVRRLPLIERGAADERNFVKKGASWALRAVGGRSDRLRSEALKVAERLDAAPAGSAARWVGRDAIKSLRR